MTRAYSISIADNSMCSRITPATCPIYTRNPKAHPQHDHSNSNIPPALSLRSSSTASMLPKTKRVAARSTTGWDTPRMSQQQRIVMQRFDKQARHQKLMKRLFSYGFLK
jgi:hypothetical protein